MDDKVTISIPRSLYERAEKWVNENEDFSSVEELVAFLLREFVSEESEEVYSPEEEEEIRERLRRLGYI
ncbi:MAG: CopG family transcriptional regulator [Candidatus Korarchaeota archaeon]|nr:CopG family transcriptional regulator [Candidatus Korarchaeota archaeon]